jgi:hypothetical protein
MSKLTSNNSNHAKDSDNCFYKATLESNVYVDSDGVVHELKPFQIQRDGSHKSPT